eukprot:3484935-Prymnesium_polylepis.2
MCTKAVHVRVLRGPASARGGPPNAMLAFCGAPPPRRDTHATRHIRHLDHVHASHDGRAAVALPQYRPITPHHHQTAHTRGHTMEHDTFAHISTPVVSRSI